MFCSEGGETEQVVQRYNRCLTPGSIQDEVRRDFEQPDLVKNVPSQYREVGLDDL